MTLSNEEIDKRLSSIKLLALDVDGVLTDGGLYYTETGEELKKFNVKDGLGIKRLMSCGIQVAIISSNSSKSTIHRARNLNVAYTFVGVKNKLPVLQNLCETLRMTLVDVAYMGDDLPDLPILNAVGCPITVADASSANKDAAILITRSLGGQGAVREVSDRIISCRSLMPSSFKA
jgi:3-deoxy-D-manno-octulosonate 8-phosphate phosphatase (KDO 8-P phosphatase)